MEKTNPQTTPRKSRVWATPFGFIEFKEHVTYEEALRVSEKGYYMTAATTDHSNEETLNASEITLLPETTPWWKFWNPKSGLLGGILAGMLVSFPILYFLWKNS